MSKDRPGNQTAGTPDLSESELREMKVDDLRRRAVKEGVRATSGMRKEELVKAVSEAHRSGAATTEPERTKTTESKKGDSKTAESKTGDSKGAESKGAESKGGGSKSAESKGAESKTGDSKGAESKGAESKGAESKGGGSKSAESKGGESKGGAGTTSSKGSAKEPKDSGTEAKNSGTEPKGEAGSPGDVGPDEGHMRTGDQTSKSLKYSQEITSPEDEPERAGRSLVTTSHEVIRQWAEERGGVPSTVPGTEHDDRAGVLRFDFGGDSDRLEHISWDDWFATFDERGLNFIYQEERSDGRQSTFFRLENPGREDA